MAALADALIAALSGVNAPLSRWARNLAAVLLAAMFAIVVVQIGLRAVFGQSIPWAEESARIMLVWTAFLIAPWAHRMGANVAILMFQHALPRTLRFLLALTINLLAIWICVMLLGAAIEFVARGMQINAATLPFKMGWAYAIAPAALIALILVGIELSLRTLMGLVRPDADYHVPGAEALTAPE